MQSVTRTMLWALLVVLCVMARPAVGQQSGTARGAGASGVQVDKNSIGGVVLNSHGAKPEAGVWVIAETTVAAGAVPQDRRHRRSGTVLGARFAGRGI